MAGEEVQEPCHGPLKKGLSTLLIILIAILSIMFTYYLLYSNSPGSDITSTPAFAGSFSAISRRDEGGQSRSDSYIRHPGMSVNSKKEYLLKGQCDLFSGQWLSDPSGTAYTNLTCSFIESHQNCLRNGRPDIDYLHWRWRPYGCELPPFDPFKFMDAMKDKSWAYIGDSVVGNQMQSMICLLSKVEEPVKVYHDKTNKSQTSYFANHNFTISLFWAPFLVKPKLFEDEEGKPKFEFQLHLDILDEKWTSQYNKFDYVIFAGGQWFLKTLILWVHNTIVGCHDCNNHNIKELGVSYPYRKALQTVYEFMTSSDHKPLIFFRTWPPDHFEYGEWFNGGICNRTHPYSEGEYNGKPIDHVMRTIEIEEFEKATLMASRSGAHLKLLDTFHLSVLRPDGHPGPYHSLHPFDTDKTAKVQNDCLHWCMPGPIDTWNELVMKILFDESDISYN